MEKKMIGTRLNADVVDNMNYFCGVTGITQVEFLTEAITKLCKEKQLVRAGGAVATLPNPGLFIHTEDEARAVIEVLSNASNQVAKINPALDFGLSETVAFATQRLFKDSPDAGQRFRNNLNNDLENMKKGENEND